MAAAAWRLRQLRRVRPGLSSRSAADAQHDLEQSSEGARKRKRTMSAQKPSDNLGQFFQWLGREQYICGAQVPTKPRERRVIRIADGDHGRSRKKLFDLN